MGYFTISPLLTTASQVRHAPRLSQCTLQNEFYLPCSLHDSKSLLISSQRTPPLEKLHSNQRGHKIRLYRGT